MFAINRVHQGSSDRILGRVGPEGSPWQERVYNLDPLENVNSHLRAPMTLSIMESRHHVFRIPETGLYFSAKCYYPNISADEGLTYIFIHNAASRSSQKTSFRLSSLTCTSTDKEAWEPTIQHLFHLSNDPQLPFEYRVRETWSLEWQSHGESALLNVDALAERDSFGTPLLHRGTIHILTRHVSQRYVRLGTSCTSFCVKILCLAITLSQSAILPA